MPVAPLVRVSEYPSSSVNDARTLKALPASPAVRMYVEPVASAMSLSVPLAEWIHR